jgi:hypothetical protein
VEVAAFTGPVVKRVWIVSSQKDTYGDPSISSQPFVWVFRAVYRLQSPGLLKAKRQMGLVLRFKGRRLWGCLPRLSYKKSFKPISVSAKVRGTVEAKSLYCAKSAKERR